jgi:hypothetical protein
MIEKWVCICGSRYWKDAFEKEILKTLDLYNPATTMILVGDCKGVDEMVNKLATNKNFKILEFTAFWDRYGKPAGPRRNGDMLDYADVVYAFTDNFHKSKGTKVCINMAKRRDIETHVFDLSHVNHHNVNRQNNRPQYPLGYQNKNEFKKKNNYNNFPPKNITNESIK